MSSQATKSSGGKVAAQLGLIVVLSLACVWLFFGDSLSSLFASDSDPATVVATEPPAPVSQTVISPVAAATLTADAVVEPEPPATVSVTAIPPEEAAAKQAWMAELRDLRRSLDRKGLQLRLLQTEQQLVDVETTLDGSEIGITRLPELVGIVGGQAGRTAEFHVGAGRLVEARAQEWVTPEWQVVSIDTNAVQMRSKRGKVTTVLFGMRPSEDAPQTPTPQQGMPVPFATATTGG